MIGRIILGGVLYSMFFKSNMSLVFCLGLLLLLLLSIFCLKRNSRILVFLFRGLFFLITSFSLSIPMNSRGFVGDGLLKVNASLFWFCILCLDRPSLFLFTRSESAVGAMDSCSVVVNVVWERASRVGKLIIISVCERGEGFSFINDEGVFISSLFISLISFCIRSPCLGVGVSKFSVSIFSIWIWLNLMKEGVFRVKTSFGYLSGMNLTLLELGFFKLGEEWIGLGGEKGFVIGAGDGVIFANLSSNSCFCLTS
jgi:hypothetical protein